MKRKRIAGVCITLAAVVLAGTFAVSGNNTKDKNTRGGSSIVSY